MNGAREFCKIFTEPGQIGNLYLLPGSHARGKTFQVFIMEDGVKAKVPHKCNPPVNGAVEVYGVTSGQPGWTESYGWLHEGPWKDDFYALVKQRDVEAREKKKRDLEALRNRDAIALEEQRAKLDAYRGMNSGPVDQNADSTMPQEWRDMLDRHPNKVRFPYAVINPRGKILMVSSVPTLLLNQSEWASAHSICVAIDAGEGWRKSLYHIPQDEPAEESGEDDGGWIEWGGGECPFTFDESERLRLDVGFRRGDGVGDVGAHRVVFSHDGQPGHPPGREAALDIVKYRKSR